MCARLSESEVLCDLQRHREQDRDRDRERDRDKDKDRDRDTDKDRDRARHAYWLFLDSKRASASSRGGNAAGPVRRTKKNSPLSTW